MKKSSLGAFLMRPQILLNRCCGHYALAGDLRDAVGLTRPLLLVLLYCLLKAVVVLLLLLLVSARSILVHSHVATLLIAKAFALVT